MNASVVHSNIGKVPLFSDCEMLSKNKIKMCDLLYF
jgi:hypothetical protein